MRAGLLGAVGLAIGACGGQAVARSIAATTLAERAGTAELIVVAQVGKVKGPDAVLKLERVLKASSPQAQLNSTLTARVTDRFSSDPTPAVPGAKLVLFLNRSISVPGFGWEPVGSYQGVMTIEGDTVTGQFGGRRDQVPLAEALKRIERALPPLSLELVQVSGKGTGPRFRLTVRNVSPRPVPTPDPRAGSVDVHAMVPDARGGWYGAYMEGPKTRKTLTLKPGEGVVVEKTVPTVAVRGGTPQPWPKGQSLVRFGVKTLAMGRVGVWWSNSVVVKR